MANTRKNEYKEGASQEAAKRPKAKTTKSSAKQPTPSSKTTPNQDREVQNERQEAPNQDQVANETSKRKHVVEIFLEDPDDPNAMVSSKSTRKVAKLGMTDGMIREICSKVKNVVWRKIKFMADEAQGDKLAKMIFHSIKLDRNSPKMNILAFINTYQDKCCRELNARHTYLMGRLEGPVLQFKNDETLGNGQFLTDEQMEMCLKREIDVNDTLQMDNFRVVLELYVA
jgi:hypothetical protein